MRILGYNILKGMYVMYDDTIAAIATAIGEAGIGIVRISGKEAVSIASRVFLPKKKTEVYDIPSRHVVYGYACDIDGKVIDEVLLIIMRGPNSYTAEDVCEIHCHGGIIPVKRILDTVISFGARLAENGEFTKRAFLNGRIDLAQAEAVMDVISSKTNFGLENALSQLEGRLSHEIRENIKILLDVLSHIEASIDFPEHDIEDVTIQYIDENIDKTMKNIKRLIDTYDEGKIIRDGLKTAIIGRPNVGKSSLLNVILKENRAIVTEIPGTTRDIIEEYVNIGGILINIIDTAGIRNTEDVVEKLGVLRTKNAIDRADLIIYVIDVSSPLLDEDFDIINMIKGRKVILVGNKMDIGVREDASYIEKVFSDNIIFISAKYKKGIEELENKIKSIVFGGYEKKSEGNIVSNARHKELLQKAYESLKRCQIDIKKGAEIDLLSLDIRDAWNYLGKITGDTVEEDIINEIFRKFCVGK